MTGSPRKATVPLDGAINPATQRSSVDLPLPDLPSRATISPARTSNDTPSSTGSGPSNVSNVLVTWSTSISKVPSATTGRRSAARNGHQRSPPPTLRRLAGTKHRSLLGPDPVGERQEARTTNHRAAWTLVGQTARAEARRVAVRGLLPSVTVHLLLAPPRWAWASCRSQSSLSTEATLLDAICARRTRLPRRDQGRRGTGCEWAGHVRRCR